MVYVAVTECQAKLTQVFSYGIVYLHFYEIKVRIVCKYNFIISSLKSKKDIKTKLGMVKVLFVNLAPFSKFKYQASVVNLKSQ